MSAWVWIDGRVSPTSRATVAADDRGLLLGEGIFEAISVRERKPFMLQRHLDRLRTSSKITGIAVPWSDPEIATACTAVIDAAASDLTNATSERLRVRITVTGGSDSTGGQPTMLVMAAPAGPAAETAAVAVSPWPVNEMSPTVGAKVTSRHDYTMALADARARGADEAVLVNTRGMLTEGSVSNLFLVVAGRLSTPSLSTGCLPGVTRSVVMDLVEVHERDDLTVDDLRFATEAFLTSTSRGVQPIASVDDKLLRSVPGPLTTAAHNAIEKLRSSAAYPV